MEILIHNLHLRAVITDALAELGQELPPGETPWNGFLLLKHRSHLARTLLQMQRDYSADPQCNFRVAILSLLINGILDDPQVFQSYDFFWLQNQGVLEFADWAWLYPDNSQKAPAGHRRLQRDSSDEVSMDTAEYLDDAITNTFATLIDIPTGCNSHDNRSIVDHRGFELACPHQENDEINGEAMPPNPSGKITPVMVASPKGDINLPPCKPWEVDPDPDPLASLLEDVDGIKLTPEGKRYYVSLCKAIRSRNIVHLQHILQHEADRGCNYHLGSPELMAQHNAEVLLLAIRMDCIRSVKLLLRHGYDINCHLSGHTPLSAAAIHGSDSLVRLLLHSGAEAPVATLILQSRGFDPRNVRRINSLARSHNSHVAQRKLTCNRNLIRLRNSFREEHALMMLFGRNQALEDILGRVRVLAAVLTAAFDDDYDPCPSWSPSFFHIEQDADSAWAIGIKTMHALFNGNISNNAHDLLLFLAVAKSMAPIIDKCGVQSMETKFFADLSRWQLVVRQDEKEHKRFVMAVNEIWGIDVTKSLQDPLEDTSRFETEILHMQQLIRRLVIQANIAFQITNPNELHLPQVQALWRDRQATSRLCGLEEPIHETIQDDTYLSFTNDDPIPPVMDEVNALRPPGEGRTSETWNGIQSPCTPNSVLVMVLAGSIFAIILAFLLCKSSEDFSH